MRIQVDLTDPELFRTNAFWNTFTFLRAEEPVYRHDEADGPGFWVLSRYRDVVDVYGRHAEFSSRQGMRLDSNPDAIAAVAQRMLIVADAPDHTHLKRVLMRAFGPNQIARMTTLVRGIVAGVLEEAVEKRDIDFIDVAKVIPNNVVCALMGIPRTDWEWIGALTTEAFESGDDERSGAHAEIFLYFTDLLAERRAYPGDDLVSQIIQERRATGEPGVDRQLTDEEVVFNLNGILAGANETTRYSAAGGVLELARDGDQWARLRRESAGVFGDAVEEILRWTTPGVHAMRTATRDTSIGGTHIAAGERVTLWNSSANRDEEVFAEADRFDIGRRPNRHVTFGHGHHLCLGARLARLELSIFLAELCDRVERIELTGEPQYNSSNFTWGVCALPVRLVTAGSTTGR